MSRSIQKTWLAILLLFALLPMLAVGGILSWMGSDLQVRQALSVQDQIALRSEALLANFVEEALMEMNILVRSPGFVSGSTDQRLELLARTIFERNLFDSLTVVDNTGMERLRVARIGITPPDRLTNRAADPLFSAANSAALSAPRQSTPGSHRRGAYEPCDRTGGQHTGRGQRNGEPARKRRARDRAPQPRSDRAHGRAVGLEF
jgi:hypothetical protein